jgi:hypothetical protein
MTGKPSQDEESSKSQTTPAQNFQDILEKSAEPKSQKSSKNAKGFGA